MINITCKSHFHSWFHAAACWSCFFRVFDRWVKFLSAGVSTSKRKWMFFYQLKISLSSFVFFPYTFQIRNLNGARSCECKLLWFRFSPKLDNFLKVTHEKMIFLHPLLTHKKILKKKKKMFRWVPWKGIKVKAKQLYPHARRIVQQNGKVRAVG